MLPIEEKNCSGFIQREYLYAKGFVKRLADIFRKKERDIVIVPCRGNDIHYKSLRYYPDFEIVPMIWDAWPVYWKKTFGSLKRLKVRTCFCSSGQVAATIREKLGINAVWIPEGIDIQTYPRQPQPLGSRNIDVFELGRRYEKYHTVIEELIDEGMIKSYAGKKNDADGNITELAFPTAQSLIEGMYDSKCVICFPRCMSHPQVAGNIETLTIRYWESMLAGCLMIGHAPRELVDLIGYNPVIEVDWSDPRTQLREILSDIGMYDGLVRKNRESALAHASWDSRMEIIRKTLAERF